MTDSVQQLFARFSAGDIAFGTLQQELVSLLLVNPELTKSALTAVEDLYKAGRLPPQIYQVLMSNLGPAAGDFPLTPQPDHGAIGMTDLADIDHRTRLKPAPAGPDNRDEATRVRQVEIQSDTTIEAVPQDDTQRRSGVSTATFGSTGTGSNWESPEQWSTRHEGPLGPGDSISRYYIESVLGEGGMGVVFKARDRLKEEAKDPDPFVAIKVLSEDFRKHPQSFIALAREWKKAASLSHENIITVYNFDRVGTTVFMTMELLDGEPLDKVLKRFRMRGLPKERATKIIEGCAKALAFAHSKGVVHSDFKPGNVFVTENDEIKVLDFGIARAVPTGIESRTDETVFDAADLGAMTPTYASAQMLAGKAPAPSDDVYALAIVAYELFAGRHPFDRTPADVAQKKGFVVAPLVGPSRRQRRAIMQGLAFDDSRQRDAGVFFRQWHGLRLPAWVWGSFAASIVAILFFAFRSLQAPGPDVPFDQLSQEDQRAFHAAISDGDSRLAAASEVGSIVYRDAFTRFVEAYSIHPRNPEAEARLEKIADIWLARIGENGAAMAEWEVNDKMQVVGSLFCDAHLHDYAPVVRVCSDTFGDAKCIWTESDCLKNLLSD